MIWKLFFASALVSLQSVDGQRGSFLGTAKEPLCVKIDNYVNAISLLIDN